MDRGADEEAEYQQLRKQLDLDGARGENVYQRTVAKALSEVLDRMIEDGSKKLDTEAKRQLRELFETRGDDG